MGIYELGVRTVWRGFMRVAETRIAHAGKLGAAMPGAGQGRSVLLVHGYGNSSASMRALRELLERDGFQVEAIDLPDHGYGDLMRDAELVGEQVRRMTEANGGAAVDVIGHSRGGVVARAWKQLLGGAGTPGRVVTVSSANQGVHLGPLDGLLSKVLPEGLDQIRRGAQIIRRLAQQPAADVVPVGTRGFDGMLLPAPAAQIPWARLREVDEGRTIGPFSRIGHWGILRDDHAYETIRGALLAQ